MTSLAEELLRDDHPALEREARQAVIEAFAEAVRLPRSSFPPRAVTARLDVRTEEARRLPPGQIVTRKWPVLHYGTVPTFDAATWRFRITGQVERPVELTWAELQALPRQETLCDIHCVTRWSRYDNLFAGRAGPSAAGAGRRSARGPLRPGPCGARLHDQPAAGGPRPSGKSPGAEPQRRGADPGAWRAGPPPGTAPLLLEECQVGTRNRAAGGGLPWLLGAERLPHARRSLARGTLRTAGSGPDAPRSALCRLPFQTDPFFLPSMAETPRRPSPDAQADLRVKEIMRAADSWAREAPRALMPAIRAVCIRLAEMVADQRHYLAPLPEPQESERQDGPEPGGGPTPIEAGGGGAGDAPEGIGRNGAPLDRVLGGGRLGPERMELHRYPVPGGLHRPRCRRTNDPTPTGPTTSWRESSPRRGR